MPFGIKHRRKKGKTNNLRQIHIKDGMSCLKSHFGLLEMEVSSIIRTKSEVAKEPKSKERKEKLLNGDIQTFKGMQKIRTEILLVLLC